MMQKHGILVGLGLIVVLAACGGSTLSFSEYGDRLDEIRSTYEPQAEAAWVEYMQLPSPTMDDLEALFDREAAVRIEIEDALLGLEPPEEIADLHVLLVEWLTNLREADQALAARAAAVGGWDEFSRSAEYRAYESTLIGGSGVCNDFQVQLHATAARGVFAETPWMPGELKDIADAVIGCDTIPDSLDAAFGR